MKRTKPEQLRLLSTNNKLFTTGGSSRRGLETGPDAVDDEHALLKKGLVRFGHRAPLGGSVLEESPNDYELCVNAPSDPVEAEAYYSVMLADYGKSAKMKEEVAMCKFCIAKIIMGDYRDTTESKLKNIERCLAYLNEAEQALTLKKFPVTFAVINSMKAHLLRERALHLTSRDYVPNRGIAASQLEIGLKVAEDALGPLCASYAGYGKDSRLIEQACLRLETGWLLLLKISDTPNDEQGNQTYEYAIGHLERALSLFEKFMDLFNSESAFLSSAGEEARQAWIPDMPATHPSHIRALLRGRPLKTLHGTCLCLVGCAYMNWREDPEASAVAFEYLSNSIRPSMLTRECPHWVVAHHFLAKVILREPSLINRKRGATTAVNGVAHIDTAINHLSMALTSPVCKRWFYELHFQIGLSHLIRLYSVTDKLQASGAIAAALSQKQNAEMVQLVEAHLLQTLRGVTVANKGGIEAYLFFFSSLKMAELRIVQAVAKIPSKSSAAGSSDAERTSLLRSAAGFIIESLHARKCEENMDLNYLAIAQVCFLLASSHRYHLAIRCYARAMMSISCMMNRLRFLPGVNGIVTKHSDLSSAPVPTGSPEYSAIVPDEESTRISCFAISCCSKVIEWQSVCPYEDGVKRNTATTRQSPMLSVQRIDGSSTTAKRQWLFESNCIEVEVIKEPEPEPEPEKVENNKGHASLKKKPRLVEVVEKDYVSNPLEDGGVKQKKLRNEDNFFQRMQSYFSQSRVSAEHSIIKTSTSGVNAAFRGTTSIGSHFKRKLLPSKVGPAAIVSSEQGFFILSILSRLSRIQLLRTAFDLGATRGERARYLLCGLGNDGLTRKRGVGIPPAVFKELKHIQKQILSACERYPVPPGSIRDLSVRPQRDINKIFKSQLRVTKLLNAEEQCLFQEVLRYDVFLPMITSTAVLTRGISRFDRHLFDEDTLLAQDKEAEDSEDSSSEEGDRRKHQEDNSDEEAELDNLSEGSDGEIKPKKLQSGNKKRFVTNALKKHTAKPGHKLINIPAAVLQPVTINNNRRVERGQHGSDVDVTNRDQDVDREDDVVDDLDVEDVDKISPLLCNIVDGTLSSLREVLIENLSHDDAMLVWHMSVPTLGGNYALEVSAIWWDDVEQSVDNRGNQGLRKQNLVLESAKLEADTSRVSYLLQSLLDALNARSSGMRASMTVDATRALSDCFALGELLQMVPAYVRNIVICCPMALRLVPWHALTLCLPDYMIPNINFDIVEAPTAMSSKESGKSSPQSPLKPIQEGDEPTFAESEKMAPELSTKSSVKQSAKYSADIPSVEAVRQGQKEKHTGRYQQIPIIEKYAVMLGPTLSMYEMNCNKLRRIDHSAGNHKMCFIDGDSNMSPAKGALEECESVTKTWSGDPWDYVTLKGLDACVSNLTTKVDKKKRHEFEERETGLNDVSESSSLMQRAFQPAKFQKKDRSAMISKRGKGRKEEGIASAFSFAFAAFVSKGKTVRDNSAELADPNHSSDSSEGEEEEEIEEERVRARDYCDNSLTFLTARVLHICASKVVCPTPSSVPVIAKAGAPAAKTSKRNRVYPSMVFPLGTLDNRTMLTARDFVSQLYLRNCSLCILSRYGITDGNIELHSLDAEWEYVDALHLAGASTVMYPLWGGSNLLPGGALSRQLFLLRFYFELPLFAAHSHPAAEACRQTQLWLKDCSITGIRLFLDEAPIDPPMKKIIIDEVMHLHATSDSSVKSQEESKTRLFSHFLLWAPFAVSGPGTQVHPSALVEKQPKKTKKRDERPSFINSLFFKQKIHIADSSANNHKPMGLVDISDGDLRREAKILRSEGGVELADAAEAELRRRRQAKVDEVKRRMVELKEVAENRLEHLKKAAARTEQAPAESEQQVAVDADGSEAVPASEKQDAAGDADESTVEAEIPAKSLATVRLAPLTSPPIVEKETSDNETASVLPEPMSGVGSLPGMSASAAALAASRRQSRHEKALETSNKASNNRVGRI